MKTKLVNTGVYILYAMIIIIALANAFHNLSDGGVYDWDEARHGVNAYEMIENGNYIVHTYDGETDYWNVKPPFSMWVVALAYRIFGTNLFALRFFSALCLPVSTAALIVFLHRSVGRTAAVGAGLLLAVTGTRFHHLFKTGDPDALFFLACLLACIFLYLALSKNTRFLIGCGLCTALAFLTKAMHVAPLTLVVLTTVLMTRKRATIPLRQLFIYLFLPMVLPVLAWALWRFSNDGLEFFKQMFLLDVFNRIGSVVENHTGGFGYYFIVLKNLMGGWIFWGVLLLFLLNFTIEVTSVKNPPRDSYVLIIFLNMLLWPLILFTIAKTKLGWYVYPSLIGFFVLAGYSLQRLVELSSDKHRKRVSQISLTVIGLLLAIGLVVTPIENVHEMASTSSKSSVFANMNMAEQYVGLGYYTINTDGSEIHIDQSWLLHALYQGLIHRPGDITHYLEDAEDALLLITYTEPDSLNRFLAQYEEYTVIAESDQAILVRS